MKTVPIVRLTLRLPTPLYLELLMELKKRGYGSLNGLIVEKLRERTPQTSTRPEKERR